MTTRQTDWQDLHNPLPTHGKGNTTLLRIEIQTHRAALGDYRTQTGSNRHMIKLRQSPNCCMMTVHSILMPSVMPCNDDNAKKIDFYLFCFITCSPMPKLPNLVDLVPGDTESLSRRTQRSLANDESYTNGNVDIATHGHNPFLAATLHTGPIIIPDLGLALFVRTQNFAGHVPVLQERFHPGQLKRGRFRRKMSITSSCISKPARHAYRLDKIPGTL
jgi:hypothetical protein